MNSEARLQPTQIRTKLLLILRKKQRNFLLMEKQKHKIKEGEEVKLIVMNLWIKDLLWKTMRI